MTIRNLEDKTMVDNKTSDFSIEHILNRAGTSITNDKEMLTLDEFERNYTFPYNSDQFLEESYLHCTPPWLSYSRYHPPPQTSKYFRDFILFVVNFSHVIVQK